MIRHAARLITRHLPATVRARIADYRFGYGSTGASLDVAQHERQNGITELRIDRDIRFLLTPEAQPAAAFHFVDNGDSRAEMAGFLRVSRQAGGPSLLIDVGAHNGLFSLVHLAADPAHRAILLEPSAPLAATARQLLALNGMETRADVRVAGAGFRVETRSIVTDALSFARLAAEHAPGATSVPFLSLDALCGETGSIPAIVKIDVEGAEGDVLRGAQDVLARHHPVLCLELHLDVLERSGESAARILDDLSAFGYRFESPDGHALHPWRLKRSLKAIERVIAR